MEKHGPNLVFFDGQDFYPDEQARKWVFFEIRVEVTPNGDENEQEIRTEIGGEFVVCGRCDGVGTHDNPAFENGITADEWNGPDWDDESRENYMSGLYDVICEECKGARVILEPKTDLDYYYIQDEEKLARFREYLEGRKEYAREIAYEKRMRIRGIQY